MYCCHYVSPIGSLCIAGTQESICGLWIEGQKYFPASLPKAPDTVQASPPLQLACRWLDAYFSGGNPNIDVLPLTPQGSTFQKTVWKHLCCIPYGQTLTYGQLAAKIALEMGVTAMSAQAIGGAVGRNPISIMIPCHRVVGAKGQLTGYAGGIEKKQWLLQHEGIRAELSAK